MKLFTGLIFCSLVLGGSSQGYLSFLGEAFLGAKDMWRAYSDMKEANFIGADKYFHARGNFDAARRGPGGEWAARVLSDAKEQSDRVIGFFKHGDRALAEEDSRQDQEANRWGRSGKNPNYYRPPGLPDKY